MPFTPSLRFLRDLARNNARVWFEAHREDYEAHIRAPMRALIEEAWSRPEGRARPVRP